MCDEDTAKEEAAHGHKPLSRRQFNTLTAAAAMAALLPRAANAATVNEADVVVTTPAGEADCYFVHPATGKHPAVLVWPDIFGLRPAFRAMGKRLAESGYSVLVVNPFYRTAKAPVVPEGASFQDPATREKLMGLARTLSADTHVADAEAFVKFIDQQAAVDTGRKMGTTGYCMGGPIVMRTAASLPARVGAGASFHGGGLATDKPDSPHLLIPKMQAQFLIAIAENDDQRDPAAKDTLRAAFKAANLAAEIEVYAGSMHGWCPPDSAVYNKDLAERAWARLLALFEKALV